MMKNVYELKTINFIKNMMTLKRTNNYILCLHTLRTKSFFCQYFTCSLSQTRRGYFRIVPKNKYFGLQRNKEKITLLT